MDDGNASLLLLCRVQSRLCAFPIEHVVETMRPQPIQPLPDAPQFVLGLAIIRGAAVPVIDLARLFVAEDASPSRFVTVSSGGRQVALAVDEVLGVHPIPTGQMEGLPPLLRDACADSVSSIGILDNELLLVLNGARLAPEDIWAGIGAGDR